MGACCSYQSHPDNAPGSSVNAVPKNIRLSGSEREDPLTNPEIVKALIAELAPKHEGNVSMLRKHPLETKELEIMNEAVQYCNKNMRIFAQFEDDVGGKLQKYLFLIPFPFNQELFFLYQANMTEARLKELDDNIESFATVSSVCTGDEILCITKTQTKKILIVEGRNFVVLKGIKKDKNGRISEFIQSVSLTSLNNHLAINKLQSEQKNLAKIQQGGAIVEPNGSDFIIRHHNFVNPLTNVGLLIIKPTLKKSIKAHFTKMVSALASFLMTFRDFDSLLWFTSKREELIRVFIDNLELMKNPDYKFSYSAQQIADRIAYLKGSIGKTDGAPAEEASLNSQKLLGKEDLIKLGTPVDTKPVGSPVNVVTRRSFEAQSGNEEIPEPKEEEKETVAPPKEQPTSTPSKTSDSKEAVSERKDSGRKQSEPVAKTDDSNRKESANERKNSEKKAEEPPRKTSDVNPTAQARKASDKQSGSSQRKDSKTNQPESSPDAPQPQTSRQSDLPEELEKVGEEYLAQSKDFAQANTRFTNLSDSNRKESTDNKDQ